MQRSVGEPELLDTRDCRKSCGVWSGQAVATSEGAKTRGLTTRQRGTVQLDPLVMTRQ